MKYYYEYLGLTLLVSLTILTYTASKADKINNSSSVVTTLNGIAPNFSIDPTSAEVPVTGGTGNVQGDVLTLNDGCSTHVQLIAQLVSGGVVTQVNPYITGSCLIPPTNPVSVLSSTGTGTGVTVNLKWGFTSANLSVGLLSSITGGSLIVNAEAAYPIFGGENTFFGDKSGSGFYGATAFSTAMGHNCAGTGSGFPVNGQGVSCYGNDALRNMKALTSGLGQFTNVDAFGHTTLENLGLGTSIQANQIAAFGAQAGLNLIGGNGGNEYVSLLGPAACAGATNSTYYKVTCIGANTGKLLSTANTDLFLEGGSASGVDTCTSCTGVIEILSGAQTSTLSATATNTVHIENVLTISGTNVPTTSVATVAGTLAVTTMTSSTAAQTGTVCYNTTGGVITYDPTSTCLVSARKYKNIDGKFPVSIPIIMKMQVIPFHYKTDLKTQHYGMIADDLQKVAPGLVYTKNGEPEGIRYIDTIAFLIKGMQEQQEEITELRKLVKSYKHH